MNRTELVGQSFVRDAIGKLAAYSRKCDPALICLVGPAGTGKLTAAIELTRRLLCETPETELAACRCRSCCQLDLDSHEAVTTTPEPEIGIDLMRELVSRAYRRREGRKVVLLGRFDRVGPAAVQVLLKATEEPTARTAWILTTRTEPQPTIVSRAWMLRFGELDVKTLSRLYQHVGSNDPLQAVQLAASAGGFKAAAKLRFDYLQFCWPWQLQHDELLPDKLEMPALRGDLELAALCVAQAMRRQTETFGPVSIPRLDRQRGAAVIKAIDEALRYDQVRPYLLLEYARRKIEQAAT